MLPFAPIFLSNKCSSLTIFVTVFSISNTHCAQLLATNTNHRYVRSVDIYPKSETDLLLAIGLTNGRVALSTFGPSEYDSRGFPGKELGIKH